MHSNTHGSPAGPAAEAFCALVLRVALVDAAVTAERSLELAYKLFAQAQLRRWQSHAAAVVRELVRYSAALPKSTPHHCPRTTALPERGYPAPLRYRTSAFTFALTSIAEHSCGDHRRWASMLVEG